MAGLSRGKVVERLFPETASLFFLCSAVPILLVFACNSESMDSSQVNQDSAPGYQLSIIDTFGVEVGDSINMIGSITAMCHHPNGSVLILDRVAGCLRIIPETGEAFRVLRNGSGPGEFQGAQGVCALGDGRILIADYMKRNLMTYDEQGNYLGDYFARSDDDPPPFMWPVDSSSIVGVDADPLIVDGEIELTFCCARYDSDLQPSVVYYLLSGDAFSSEWIQITDELEFYADRTGCVYIVQDFTEYCIEVYTPDGTFDYVITVSVERLEKSEEQFQAEIEEYEAFAANDASYTGGYQPSKYEQLISVAGVDSEGCLWIERYDADSGYHFDVWDSDGDLVYTAWLPEFDTDLEIEFLIDEIGILGAAINADDYPRIYMLNLVAEETYKGI